MKHIFILFSMLFMLFAGVLQAQITSGQSDDFNNGTSLDWENGSNVDNMLLISADGSGSLGKLVTYNSNQWAGDYIMAGVHSISFTISNLSTETLHIRIAMGNASNPNSGTWFCSTNAIELAPNEMNLTMEFPIDEMYLTLVDGSETYNQVLSDVSVLRILHNPSISAKGVNVVADIHLDDITANQIFSDIDVVSANSVNVFPNPVNDNLTIDLGNMPPSQVTLYDISGKSINKWMQNGIKNIDMSDMPRGVYLLQISDAENIVTKRIVKK
jgi:hypothetical protein